MQVRMRRTHNHDGQHLQQYGTYDLPSDVAMGLVGCGAAVAIEPEPETATIKPAEKRNSKPKKGKE